MKMLLIILTLFILNNMSFAQDLMKDLSNINNVYATDDFTCNIDYLYFTKNNTPDVVKSQKCVYKKKAGCAYFSNGNQESIQMEKYQLYIDHLSRYIAIKPKPSGNSIPFIYDFNQLDDKKAKHNYAKKNDNNASYTIVYSDGSLEFDSVQISFNPKTFYLNKLIFYFNTKFSKEYVRFEMVFSSYSGTCKQCNFNSIVDKFIVFKDNTVLPRESYSNYRFSNHYL